MNRLAVTLCGLILAALRSASALADTVYTYTGNDFTHLQASGEPQVYTTSDFVSGEFTLSAPLGDNLPFAVINPTSFSFSDGVKTITNLNATASQIVVATDAHGEISQWEVYTYLANGGVSGKIYSGTVTGADYGTFGESGDNFALGNVRNPGKWTVSTTDSPSPVPEPSGLLLLGTGAIGGLGVFRRKLTS